MLYGTKSESVIFKRIFYKIFDEYLQEVTGIYKGPEIFKLFYESVNINMCLSSVKV